MNFSNQHQEASSTTSFYVHFHLTCSDLMVYFPSWGGAGSRTLVRTRLRL